MNDEYVVWLLVAALAGVAALLWFLYGRIPREEDDVAGAELAAEAVWISDTLAEAGTTVDADAVENVLRLHRRYLAGAVPPREPGDPGWDLPEAPHEGPELAPVCPAPAVAPRTRIAPQPVAAPSVAHDAAMERDGPRRESPEANLRQPG